VESMACVDIPLLALQLLLRRESTWRRYPVAVVESDKPQASILAVNDRARSSGILPGMRYSEALALTGKLHAAPVPHREIELAVDEVLQRLRHFSPEVEPARGGADILGAGVFWLNATGLGGLFNSLEEWARRIRADLARSALESRIVVGFSPFFTSAMAKAARGVVCFEKPADEKKAAWQVPIERLNFAPKLRDLLYKLEITTLGAFAGLPPAGMQKRFGREVAHLHRLARGDLVELFEPHRSSELPRRRMVLDYGEQDLSRLMFYTARLLNPLLEALAGRGQALREIRLELILDRDEKRTERIRPAAATLAAPQILDLIYLRLQATPLRGRVIELRLGAEGERATQEQLELFAEVARRDLDAANRALARIRAELGDEAVVCAELREAHLPEARFTWAPLERVGKAQPLDVTEATLVRRLFDKPVPLPAGPWHQPGKWMLRGLRQGRIVRTVGPHIVSGAWWRRGIHREYHFAETEKGDLLWVFYDKVRRRWFLQGRIE